MAAALKSDEIEVTNDVPDDWALNSLLLDLKENTTEDDLECMKTMFSGKGGIGKKALSDTKTTLQFFQLLKQRGFLDRNNILFLQGLYWRINKSNHRKIVEYAKESKQKPVYFFPASDLPVNGFRNVNFHLAGTEISKHKVEEIRSMVAQILCIPSEFVLWKGAEPFNSIILTFMVPSDVLDLLLNLTSEEKGYLIGLNIDKFTAGGDTKTLKGQTYDLPKVTSEEQEILRLMNKNEKMEKQIEEMELKFVQKARHDQPLCEQQLQQRLVAMDQKLEKQCKQLDAFNAMIERSYNRALLTITTLISIIFNNHQPESVAKLSQQSIMAYFRFCLGRVKRECPDKMDCIYELINIATLMAVESERQKWKHHIESMNIQNYFLQMEHVELLTLLDTKQTPNASRPLQSYILSQQSIRIQSTTALHIETVVQDARQTALMQISNLLTDRQRRILLDNSKLSLNDKRIAMENPTLTMFYVVPIGKDNVGLRKSVMDILSKVGDKQLLERVDEVFDALRLPGSGSLPLQPKSTKVPRHILKNKKRRYRLT